MLNIVQLETATRRELDKIFSNTWEENFEKLPEIIAQANKVIHELALKNISAFLVTELSMSGSSVVTDGNTMIIDGIILSPKIQRHHASDNVLIASILSSHEIIPNPC